MSYQISPQEFAEMVLDTVEGYCDENTDSEFSYLQCIANNSPDELEWIIEDEQDLQGIWKNADDKFREAVKKEYEKLWTEAVVIKLSDQLDDLLEAGFINLYEFEPIFLDKYGNPYRENVDDVTLIKYRIKLLERYKKFLDELGDAIVNATNTQTPLSCDELRKYLLKLYDTVGIEYNGYEDPIEYYIDDYSSLNKDGKLDVLSELTFSIDNVLDKIDSAIKEYKEWLEKHELEQ